MAQTQEELYRQYCEAKRDIGEEPFPFADWAEIESEKLCSCGSGEYPWWENDAQGIPLVRVCGQCEREKLSHYRPEILTGYTQADVDERIEDDY